MLAPVTHFLPLTTIRRERLLPIAGRVVVRAGQKVSATDIIAETKLVTQHYLLDVQRGLGVSANRADELVERKVGDQVNEGDIIAGPVGVFPRIIRAPRDGRIVAIGGGQVLVETDSALFEVQAGIPGTVAELVPDRGAIIETTGALIQGVWGNGRIDVGVMSVLAQKPDDVLLPEMLDIGMRGSVVMAGHVEQARVLKIADDLPLRGLILASISSKLLSQAAQLRLPVIILEGIGHHALNANAFKILSTNDKREVTINAVSWDKLRDERPEVVIPLPSSSPPLPPRVTEIFAPGQNVRIVQSPLTSAVGEIVVLRSGMSVFQNGIRASAAIVRLENGEQVMVPLMNLEVLA